MTPKIEKIGDSAQLGEGPHWDPDTQSLYFIDYFRKALHRYVPSSKQFTTALIEGPDYVSFIIPIEGTKDKFVIGSGHNLLEVTWDGVSDKVSNVAKIAEVDTEPENIENVINDAKADPSGRLWFGTLRMNLKAPQLEPNKGTLYSITKERTVKDHVHGISLSNGLTWNADLKKFYYIDSAEKQVFQFDFDVDTGSISNRETIFTLEKHNIDGLPDGQTIDSDGNLWVAVFGASIVIKIDPRKPETLLDTIYLPVSQVTSVAFGGENLDELYVTTARFQLGAEDLPDSEGHGYTYKVTGLGAKGLPAVKVKL